MIWYLVVVRVTACKPFDLATEVDVPQRALEVSICDVQHVEHIYHNGHTSIEPIQNPIRIRTCFRMAYRSLNTSALALASENSLGAVAAGRNCFRSLLYASRGVLTSM